MSDATQTRHRKCSKHHHKLDRVDPDDPGTSTADQVNAGDNYPLLRATQSKSEDMLRLLNWSSGHQAADRMIEQEKELMAAARQRAPNMQPKLKRKRADSVDMDLARNHVKRRIEHFAAPLQPLVNTPHGPFQSFAPQPRQQNHIDNSIRPATPVQTAQPSPAKVEDHTVTRLRSEKDWDMIRQTIHTQFGLEILLKHKELRLIDQELAKCQVALEQLRRCTEIPYPTHAPNYQASRGEGPALRSSFSGRLPESPAPWGVTNGPYTKHYAKWLIPDPTFDGGEPDHSMYSGNAPSKGRAGRGSIAEAPITTKGRVRAAGKYNALPNGYPVPKEKAGPMIQKRKSDGRTVKLVCLDCHRDNFSSAQGFINHCRIAHSRSFQSHDAAADACGQPIEIDESGQIIGEDGNITAVSSAVHPLIRQAHIMKDNDSSLSKISFNRSFRAPAMTTKTRASASVQGAVGTAIPDLFAPSPQTPNLSALLKKAGSQVNLAALIDESNAPLREEEVSDEELSAGEITPAVNAARNLLQSVSSMAPARSAMTSIPLARSASKGLGRPGSRLAEKTPAMTLQKFGTAPFGGRSMASQSQYPHEVSRVEPSPTNESNQAPSLIDDDDDEFEAHSTASSATDENESGDVDFEIEDDDSGPSTRQQPATSSDFAATPCQPQPISEAPAQSRMPTTARRPTLTQEERHVSFASPSPARELKRGDNKRRKL